MVVADRRQSYLVKGPLYIPGRITPSSDHELDGMLDDGLCHLSTRFVQDVVKVILAQHRVSRIGGVRVIEDFKLGGILVNDRFALLRERVRYLLEVWLTMVSVEIGGKKKTGGRSP